MSNVIDFSRPRSATSQARSISHLASSFAHRRRHRDDVFWLKENAEFLNILECTAINVPQEAVAQYSEFYRDLTKRFSFFPQYYRFLLSIALDLEALGLAGNVAEEISASICQTNLPAGDLSDLQRGEAQRLVARRGMQLTGQDGLNDRLRAFASNSLTFAIPNRKAAYELTHIVFYLSEYGRKDPNLGEGAVQSLHFAGTLAHLEENTDLLAEICVALRYCSQPVPLIWQTHLHRRAKQVDLSPNDSGAGDDYHEFLVSQWALSLAGAPAFTGAFDPHGTGFYQQASPCDALRLLSLAMLDMPASRTGDWAATEHVLKAQLPDHVQAHLEEVITAAPQFDAFFEGFTRANIVQSLSHSQGAQGTQPAKAKAPRLETVS